MYVYKTTNLQNGKIYIGLCTKSVSESVDYFGSGILIVKALIKYGRENFVKEILESNIDSIEYLNEREIYWIKFYNSISPEIGYNLSHGGKGTLGMEKSPETIEKIRIAVTGKIQTTETIDKRVSKIKGLKRSTETKKKISAHFKTKFSIPENHPMYGKSHSLETKAKMSESQKKWTRGPVSEETKKKMSESHRGKKMSQSFRELVSKAKKGKAGSKHSEETKAKMSLSHKGKYSGPENVMCPHCNKIGSSNAMYRWHFDNCKKKVLCV